MPTGVEGLLAFSTRPGRNGPLRERHGELTPSSVYGNKLLEASWSSVVYRIVLLGALPGMLPRVWQPHMLHMKYVLCQLPNATPARSQGGIQGKLAVRGLTSWKGSEKE